MTIVNSLRAKDYAKVSLRISGSDLDPHEMSRLLHCEPTFSQSKGKKSVRKKVSHIASQGTWILKCENKIPLEYIKQNILDLFNFQNVSINTWEQISNKFKIDIFVGVFLQSLNRGVVFDADLLKRLSERGIDLSLDIYCEGSKSSAN